MLELVLAQSLPTAHGPLTWAEVAERIGIPAMLLLFIMFAIVGGAYAVARWVVKPLLASHLAQNEAHVKFVETCGESLKTLSTAEAAEGPRLAALEVATKETQKIAVQLKGMIGKLGRGLTASDERRSADNGSKDE